MEHIAFFTDKLSTGGVGKMRANLSNELVSLGCKVDLVARTTNSPYKSLFDPSVRLIEIGTTNRIFALPKLVRYLITQKPDVLISDRLRLNFLALDAKRIAMAKTKICMSVHVPLSLRLARLSPSKRKKMDKRLRSYIPRNYSIIAVSHGVAHDLKTNLGFPADKIKVVYNPAVTKGIFEMAKEEVDHPWFKDHSLPILLSAGRFYPQKDYPTLIAAFKKVLSNTKCRLMILGDGELKQDIENLIKKEGLEEWVCLPGFQKNPYKYMARADLFVLSSKWEGLPNVLLETMALGTPIVSTDCPYGPKEILKNGELGPLVPVGDVEGLAHAIVKALNNPTPSEILKSAASRFTVENSAKNYLKAVGSKQSE